MTSVQTTIPFNIRKKCSFYSKKEDIKTEDFTHATAKKLTPHKYVPTVKKLMTLSSSESESDSDTENLWKACNNSLSSERTLKSNKSSISRQRKHSDSGGHDSTPPKLKKSQTLVLPSTPVTPSTLINKLNLDSSDDKEEKLTPRCLFPNNRYCNARKALHSSVPTNLPGRETELNELKEFIGEHLKNNRSGSLYVSGPPGTGKTALLSKVMQLPEFKKKINTVYINCTTMKSASTIYGKIIQELNIKVTEETTKVTEKTAKAAVEKYLVSRHKMLLLILDEIDELDSKKQVVLYSIFEWPSLKNSKLILIGIANALDLTDRMLPRLQGRCDLKPKLMHFAPYTKQQIINIISERLNEANAADIFTRNAIQMLASKVAAISGDIRTVLDISRRVVEVVELQKTSQILQPSSNNGSPKKSVVPEKSVDLKEVLSVLNTVYGGVQHFVDEEGTFPLQQKLLLCSLLLILNKGRNKDVTIGKLHEVYKKKLAEL
ncbi:cell division control protein 6 homolog isoform X2 [Prorops nasuta]|uniref:cell division control protein 6 homolog isoform X2 n=1 Tax=Prorops nasuta TaxID=863751 RepID=UPI0034CDF489